MGQYGLCCPNTCFYQRCFHHRRSRPSESKYNNCPTELIIAATYVNAALLRTRLMPTSSSEWTMSKAEQLFLGSTTGVEFDRQGDNLKSRDHGKQPDGYPDHIVKQWPTDAMSAHQEHSGEKNQAVGRGRKLGHGHQLHAQVQRRIRGLMLQGMT